MRLRHSTARSRRIGTVAAVLAVLAVLGVLCGPGPGGGRAAAADGNLDPALARALRLHHDGRSSAALALVDSLVTADPAAFGAQIVRGHLLLDLDEKGAARDAFARAVELEPERPEGHHGLGLVAFARVRGTQRALLTLKKLVFQNPEKEAIEHFQRALELEPDFHDAAIALAEVYLARHQRRDDERVLELLVDRLPAGYRLDAMLYDLGVALTRLERYGEAENDFVQLLNRQSDHNGALLRLAELYILTDRPAQASESYRHLLQVLSDPAVIDEIRLGMLPILSEQERQACDRERHAGTFLRRYWNRHDPTPTTTVNERLIEHLERLLHARTVFAATTPRGFDDRGVIEVRFGTPDERHRSAGSGTTRANESWAYSGLGNSVVTFDFVDRGGGVFVLTDDLADAISSFSLDHNDRLSALQELFQERQFLSPAYAHAANELTLLKDGSEGSVARQVGSVELAVSDYRQQSAARRAQAPRAAYPPTPGLDQLEGSLAIARFRGGRGGGGRLEVYYGLATPQLAFHRAADGQNRAVIEESFALYDADYEEVARARRQRSLVVDDPANLEQAYVGQLSIPPPGADSTAWLAPAVYNLAFALRDVSSNRTREFWLPIAIPDYRTDSLLVSDLHIAREIDERRPPPGFRPYPYHAVDGRHPLLVHYEIYGLQRAADGLSDFQLAYEVEQPGGGLRPLLGRLNPFGGAGGGGRGIEIGAERRGLEPDEVDVVELDLADLEPGRYRLTVRVTDQVTGARAASAMPIEIVEP